MPIRPELATLSQAAIKEAQEALARQDPIQAAAAFSRCAEIFAGSTDPEELDQRHTALLEAGNVLRRAGKHAESEVVYEDLSRKAMQEAGAESRPFLLARYYLGLARSERDDYAGAAEALGDSYEGFSLQPAAVTEKRLIGAALGLALLRDRRWDDAVNVLRRLAGSPLEDETAASILHNLALALVRRGDAALGLTFARSARALREKLNGTQHPLYIDTLLVLALALVDSGESAEAAQLTRTAAQAVLAGAGEAHAFFADALLVEARRIARENDGGAAEALARRALFLLGEAGLRPAVIADRRLDAKALGLLWRTAPKANGPGDVRLWKVNLQHTLRRYQVATIDFVGSGDAPRLWYYFVPASASLTDSDTALRLVRLALADASAMLNAREPADPHFLDVTSFVASEPTIPELLATRMDEAFKARTWENSIAYSVVEGDRSLTLPPAEFAFALSAYITLRGGRADLRTWVDLGVDASQLERAVLAPEAVLFETLWQA